MFELVVEVCMQDQPNVCKDVPAIPLAENNLTPQQCMMMGEQTMVEWTEQNPGWRIVKWRCGPRKEVARI